MCKETAMHAMRSIFNALENNSSSNIDLTITTKDVDDSISKTKPSTTDADNNKYKIWQSQYESH